MKSRGPRPGNNKALAPTAPAASRPRARKGKLAGSIIAISSAAIVSIYTLGRVNTTGAYDQLIADAPTAAASVAATGQGSASVRAAPTVAASASGSQSTPAVTYKDGSYAGSGNSRHGGMQVKVEIKGGKITSANVTSCSTRYPCSDINPLIGAAVSKQSVPVNHVSGATDSSQAYKQALTAALKQAKA